MTITRCCIDSQCHNTYVDFMPSHVLYPGRRKCLILLRTSQSSQSPYRIFYVRNWGKMLLSWYLLYKKFFHLWMQHSEGQSVFFEWRDTGLCKSKWQQKGEKYITINWRWFCTKQQTYILTRKIPTPRNRYCRAMKFWQSILSREHI